MLIHETLRQLGFSERQTDIYLALLKQGPSSIRDIAAVAGVNRGTTYEELKLLRARGLVSYFPKGRRRFFCAEPPETLNAMAEQKSSELAEASRSLRLDIVPSLQALQPDTATTNVFHYEGDEGIETVLKDILRQVGEQPDRLYRVYSSRQMRKYLYRPFPSFTRQRVLNDIRVRVIAIGPGGEEAPLAERKWLEAPSADTNASYVAIYPPRCAMISLVKGDYPTAVVVESDAIARALRLSFDALWERL